jgi:FkbM family methyltransferase
VCPTECNVEVTEAEQDNPEIDRNDPAKPARVRVWTILAGLLASLAPPDAPSPVMRGHAVISRAGIISGVIQRLIRTLYPYGGVRRVLWGPAAGMRFSVEPTMGVTYAIGHPLAMPRYFDAHLSPGMTVFDVGANKGQMMLLFAKLVGPRGRVVAFEPAPAEFRALQRNVALNGLDQVTTVQAAVSDAAGEMTFMYDAANPTQGKLRDVEPTYSVPGAVPVPVPTRPLDDFLAQGLRPNLIKIDVEGGGLAVLRGAAQILETIGPRILIELHGPEEQLAVRDELLSRRYVAETIDGVRVEDPTAGWNSPLWCYRVNGTPGGVQAVKE